MSDRERLDGKALDRISMGKVRPACVLCGQTIGRRNYSMLCPACKEKHTTHSHRAAAYDEAWAALHRAQERLTSLVRDCPDAAPLVAQVRAALAATLPALDAAHQEMQTTRRAVDTRTGIARALLRQQTGGDSWRITSDGVSGNTYVSPPAARTRKRLAAERAQDASEAAGDE
jgi:hypothetical protein